MIEQYLLPAGAVLLLTVGGYGWYERRQAQGLRLELSAAQGELATCTGRLTNVLEDIQSDLEIDAIPDSGLGVVPGHWLLPNAAGDARPL